TKTQKAEGTESEGIRFTLLKATSLGLSRSGYVFSGWAESSDSNYVRFSDGDDVHADFSGSKTLYAVWSLPIYQISYHKTDDYGVTAGSTAFRTVTGKTTITLPTASSLGLSRSGYTFLGWKTERNASTYYKVGSSYTVTGSITLYGVWQKNCIYVYLYHPGYATSAKTKFGTMAASIGNTTKSFSVTMRNGSYPTGVAEFSISSSGKYAWATSVLVQKTGYKASNLVQSGTYNFVLGGTYQINVLTGVVTKTK
ncbi:MAG: InlB B-repeat-containing protein, partial [Treponema sp.]|nr:InlB B-repeat-containing protein [Treponema sp.]